MDEAFRPVGDDGPSCFSRSFSSEEAEGSSLRGWTWPCILVDPISMRPRMRAMAARALDSSGARANIWLQRRALTRREKTTMRNCVVVTLPAAISFPPHQYANALTQ